MSSDSYTNDSYFIPAANMHLSIPEQKATSAVTNSTSTHHTSTSDIVTVHVEVLPENNAELWQPMTAQQKTYTQLCHSDYNIFSQNMSTFSQSRDNASQARNHNLKGELLSSTIKPGEEYSFPENKNLEDNEEEDSEEEGDEGDISLSEDKEEEEEEEENSSSDEEEEEQASSDRIDRAHKSNMQNNLGDSSTSKSNDRHSSDEEDDVSYSYRTIQGYHEQKDSEEDAPITEGVDFLITKTDELEITARNTHIDSKEENKHLHNDTWSAFNAIPFTFDMVNLKLGVPADALSVLHRDKCVIAGGAALYLGCPWTKWSHRCDVDFFVFDTPEAVAIIVRLCNILTQQGYIVCQSSASVLTAIGYYGMRRIQIIRSGATCVDHLILGEHGFDIDAVKAYYDGHFLVPSVNAETNWRARKCTTYTYRYVEPIRLYGMLWKGFELSAECMQHIKNVIGWPLGEKFRSEYENNIVCLNRELPITVQEYQLNKMNLHVIKELQETVEAMNCKQNDYIKIFTFAGTYEEYVRTSMVDKKPSKVLLPECERTSSMFRSPINQKYYSGVFYSVFSDYNLRLPLCRVIWRVDFTSKRKEDRIMGRVEMCNPEEHKRLVQLEQALYEEIEDKEKSRFDPTHAREIDDGDISTMIPTTNINIKLASDVRFYVNGVRVNPPVLQPRTQISLVAWPNYFYDNRDRGLPNTTPELYTCKLVWQVKKIFVISRD